MEFLIGLAVVWLVGVIIWTRGYLRRRCGVDYGWFRTISIWEPGAIRAVLVGITWPVTIFLATNPAPCHHRSHELARAEARARFEAEEQQLQRARRLEGH